MGGKVSSKSQKMYCGAKCLFLNLTGVFSFLGLLGCAAAGALYIFMVEETEDILQLIALVGTAMCLFTLVINATIMCNCLCCSSGNEKKRRVWFTLFFLLTAAVAVLQVIEDPKETSLAACEEIQCPSAESVTPTDCPDDEDQVYKSCLADNANRDNVDDSNRVFMHVWDDCFEDGKSLCRVFDTAEKCSKYKYKKEDEYCDGHSALELFEFAWLLVVATMVLCAWGSFSYLMAFVCCGDTPKEENPEQNYANQL